MTPDEIQLAKAGIEQALKPYTNLIEKLFGPAAEGIGQGFRAMLGPWVVERQIRFWQRTQEMIVEAGFDPQPIPPKLLLPILQNASQENDAYLQDQWAALLANASNPSPENELPVIFAEILRQLSAREVKFLQIAYRRTYVGQGKRLDEVPIGNSDRVHGLFRLSFGAKGREPDVHRGVDEEFRLAMDNLLRLGIIATTEEVRDLWAPIMSYPLRIGNETYKVPESNLRKVFQFKSLGFQLIRACQTPKKKP